METFGEKLRIERERRGLSIQAVAEALHVPNDRLVALERDDFRDLPGNDVMADLLRAYAECLQVEADLMIGDYLRQREICLRELDHSLESARLPPPRVAVAPGRGRLFPIRITALALIASLGALGAWWLLKGEGPPVPPDALTPPVAGTPDPGAPDLTPAPTPAPTSTPAVTSTTPPEPLAVRPEPPAERASPPVRLSTGMSVTEHGVGTGVSGRRLVGRANRFPTGSQVWFWTNVSDGHAGDRVEHVWLHEGREMFSISFGIGGSRWRVHSAKLLSAPGAWVAEARAADGRVLARDEFLAVR